MYALFRFDEDEISIEELAERLNIKCEGTLLYEGDYPVDASGGLVAFNDPEIIKKAKEIGLEEA